MSHALHFPCEEAAIRAGASAPAQPARGGWVLAATILGSSLAFIDMTVVNVALPALARELGASGADLLWVVEAYALFLSALLLVGGALGDRFGRRRIFGAGVALFGLSSASCALAPSIAWLIGARALQGVGGALLVPGSLALISASFDQGERGRAIGTWSGASGITAALGPLLGGWLVSISWRWAFLLNVPLCALVLVLLARVPESRNPRVSRLDLPGAALATLGLGGLVFALIESPRRGTGDPAIVVAFVLGLAAVAAFVWRESRTPAPMLPLQLFRSSEFAGANLLTLFLYGALGCVLFFLPLTLIQVHGYSPLGAGAALLPLIVILSSLSRWSGGLVARLGPRPPLLLGPAIAAMGFFALSWPSAGGSYWSTFFPGLVILGFGMALSVAPLTTTVMNAVEVESAGVASGVNNAVSRTAGLLAIALLGILLTATFDGELERRLRALAPEPAARAAVWAERGRLAALEPPPGWPEPKAEALRDAVRESYVAAFRSVARASALLALLGSAAAAIWIRRPARPGPSTSGS